MLGICRRTSGRCFHPLRDHAWRETMHGARGLRLNTEPNATLRVSGSATHLVVKTNMETYAASLEATTNESGASFADEQLASWMQAGEGDDNHDLNITVNAHAATVAIPASFNVEVAMDGACDVDMSGWLEGTVDIAVGGLGAVRGAGASVRSRTYVR